MVCRSPSRWLVAVISVLCVLAPLPIARAAAQQAPQKVPQIGIVPDSLPEVKRAPLHVVYTKLVAMRDMLRTRAKEHNVRCGSVEIGSAEEQACQQEQSRFISEREQYIRAVNHFNDMLQALAGENLGVDLDKWKQAIKAGRVQAAIEKVLMAATQRGELTELLAAQIKVSLGPPMVLKDDDHHFLAQRVIVPGPPGKPPVVDSYKFAELTEGETVDSAAQELVRKIRSDKRIVTWLQDPAAPVP